MAEITVDFPTAGLSETGWRTRLESLAARAEAMVGKPSTLQAQAALATEFFGLLWPAMGPELVSGSCRATLLLQVPVVLNGAPADAVQEVSERLDAVWAAAQEDPSAAVVEAPVLLLDLPPAAPRIGRPPKAPEPAPLEPEPVVEATPAPEPEPEPEPVPVVEVEPEPVVLEPAPPPPSSWLTTSDAAELLGTCRATVCSWREAGRFGVEGVGFVHHGRGYWHSPEAVEAVEADCPAGLDELLSEVKAE